MKTKAIIEYGAMDVTAKADSTLSATDKQNFSTPNNIKLDPTETKYSTLEHNYFALDGSFTNMPSNVGNVGYWSLSKTGANKEFTTPLTLTINFTKNHSSVGLTLTFSQYSYCTQLKISYYDSNNTLLSEETFTPDSYEYFCEDIVANYRKIVITFYKTNEANRYLKLYRIKYGKTIIFEGDNLVSANLCEELDPLGDELSINTLDFVSFATDDKFNILNPQGAFVAFQKTQTLKAYKVADDVLTDMGTFYLESWENKSEKSMEIRGIDAIGIMDKIEFNGGIYSNMSAVTLIESIFAKANITAYTIEDITSDTITGYLPICTCREALQQILFTLGAVADCSRSDTIRIYKLTEAEEPNEITSSQILQNTKEIKQTEIVTGVSVTTHSYKLKIATDTIYEENLTAGTYKVIFNQPCSDLAITGGSIIESGVNYAIINATGSSSASSKYRGNKTVTITGSTYDDLTNTVTITDGEYHDVENILTISDCTLINGANANTIATRVLNYYQGSYKDTMNIILDDEKVGDNVLAEKSEVNQLNGFVTKLDIDMTGGFLAKTEIMAKVEEVDG